MLELPTSEQKLIETSAADSVSEMRRCASVAIAASRLLWSIALAGFMMFLGALLYHHAIDPFNERALGADGMLYLMIAGFAIFIVAAIATMMTSSEITRQK